MSKIPKLVAFDLDGTLSESKAAINAEMAGLLSQLAEKTKVAVISGGSFEQFEKQILSSGEISKKIIFLPAEGSEKFEYDEKAKEWKMTDREIFPKKLKKEVIDFLNEMIASGEYEIPEEHFGEYVEDRDTEIAISALGQNAPLEKKEVWDTDHRKRRKIKEVLENKFKTISATIAGLTSVDILPKGFTKATGLLMLLHKLKIPSEDIVFVGDAIFPEGNDYSVFEAGMKTIKVAGPEETAIAIKAMIEDKVEFPKNPVAFFCSEYALEDDSAMYAGGLGILAGDYLLEIADKNMPFMAFGFKYGDGKPKDFFILPDTILDIPIGAKNVKTKIWYRSLSENTFIFLFDTNIPENLPEDRDLTSRLYDDQLDRRFKQQIILSIGGIRFLNKFNISPSIYHLNEGHVALVGLAIMAEKKEDIGKIVGTKHTILSEAGLLINFSDFNALFGEYLEKNSVSAKEVFEIGRDELNVLNFSTTNFLLALSVRKNAVSVIHAFFEKQKHPQSQLIGITNGVYKRRWQAEELLGKVKKMSDEELWDIKRKLREKLFSFVKEITGRTLDPDICTLVWARRFAVYKRPFLLFSDYERLVEIVSDENMPLQVVISGKAHNADQGGKEILEKIVAFSNDPRTKGKVVYVPNYSLNVAQKLVLGADIWLNTPVLGKEACGTSGMKAGLNGGLECSVRDGWVDEVNWEGKGWILPPDETAPALYNLLVSEILPCFYTESGKSSEKLPSGWITRMRDTIEIIEKSYTTERMLAEYMEKLYKI